MATAPTLPYGLLALSPRRVAVVSPRGRLYRVTVDDGGQAIRCTCPGHVHTGRCKHRTMVERTLQGNGLELPDGRRIMAHPRTTRDETAPETTSVPSPEIRCPKCGRWVSLLDVRLAGPRCTPRFVCGACHVSSVGDAAGMTEGR